MGFNLVAYGCYIHPDTWPESCKKCFRVRIHGYERRCNHMKVSPENDDKGVFNIVEKEGSHFNGVLLQGINEKDWKDIVYKERGYGIIEIPKEDIITDNKKEEKPEKIKMFKGVRSKDNITSDMEYVKMCISGSKKLGNSFMEEFIDTSYVYKNGEKKLLREYIEDSSIELEEF